MSVFNKHDISQILNVAKNARVNPKQAKKSSSVNKGVAGASASATTIAKPKPTAPKQTTLPTAAPPKSSTEFAKRSNKGKVEVHYNPEIPSKCEFPKDRPSISITENDPLPIRYMNDVKARRGTKLYERLKVFQMEMEEQLCMSAANVDEVTPIESLFVGRILCETTTGEGKLNRTSILLEGRAQELAESKNEHFEIVKLDINNVEDVVSFFPGQFVAVLGTNPSGTEIRVTEVYTGFYNSDVDYIAETAAPKGLSILVAAGPYCFADSIASYDPLDELINAAKEIKPDLVILTGPFVDSEHPTISSGDHDDSYEELFARCTEKLAKIGTQTVLVPSLRDIHHDFVYPQPPFQVHGMKTTSNPALITVNGVSIGVTSHDILKQLSECEYSTKLGTDRMKRIAEHLIQQRTFYPPSIPAPGVPLDYSLSDFLAFDSAPSILIMPSDLQYFVKETSSGVLLVNPKRVALTSAGGTYAHIKIYPNHPSLKPVAVAAPEASSSDNKTTAEPPAADGIHLRTEVKIIRV